MAESESTGTLIVRVTAADKAVPIEGATVAVRLVENTTPVIFAVLTTDASGKTEPLAIPTPAASLSLEPGNGQSWSVINVEATCTGYYGYATLGAPVFAGQTSILDVNLIPLPDSSAYGKYPNLDTVVNELPGPSL